MNFKKSLLVAAMGLSLPFAAGALEVLDEEALDAVTGQDGIRVQMQLNLNTDVTVHDLDGFSYNSYVSPMSFTATSVAEEGAIVIDGMGVNTGAGVITIDIDAGDTAAAATTPTLNINVSIPANTVIQTGAIGVANSNRDVAAISAVGGNVGGDTWGASTAVAILDNSAITLGATTLNVQLGNEPQGNMVVIGTVMTGGLNIAGLGFNDVNSGGTIGADALALRDTGGANLSILAGIDVESDGVAGGGNDRLAISVDQLGSGQGIDVRMERVYLGVDPGTPAGATAGYLGDVEVNGLTLTGTIYVSGK